MRLALRGLYIFQYRNIILPVPRAATSADVFNAIAESRRRDILVYLAPRERPVGDVVAALRLRQPSVSKHLKVLRDVGVVHVRREGRHVFYRTNVEAIKPLHDWTRTFERFWRHQLTRVRERAEGKIAPQRPSERPDSDEGGNP